ncbi:MAG: ribonuclease III [Propionibacteriaceae bacterium]|nr:ribonuclease III [Propionibacteriaceae bacterium]
MSVLSELLDQLEISADPDLIELALTHSSFAYENGRAPDNERLEFLGDAVLELVVTDHLYRTFTEDPEGRLAKLRAAVVNSHSLAEVARKLELGPLLKLGKGEIATGGSKKASLLANATEAVIGAVYLSCGMEASSKFVHYIIDPQIDKALEQGMGLDWKTSLQELTSSLELGMPEYVVEESGPDHNKHFVAYVQVGEWKSQTGEGSSKKVAEQGAAKSAYEALSAEHA